MKIKSFLTVVVAAVAIVLGMCSCGDDDDDPVVAVAEQVAGSYTGNEVIKVMGEESSNGTATYGFVKASDTSLDMTVPEAGDMGPMSIPALVVKNIPLTQSDNTVTGRLASYSGTVKTANGDEKAYTISNVTVIFKEKAVVATFSLKFGNMPFEMVTTFSGTKK